jgi:hypothetical protein
MEGIIFQAPAEDQAFFDSLKAHADSIETVKLDRFEGLVAIVQIVVTVMSSAGIAILVAYLREKTQAAKARILIKDGRKIRLQGYTAEEAERILAVDRTVR